MAQGRARIERHGANHICGGSDPIPGICDFISGSGTGTYRDCVLANPHVVAFWAGDEPSGDLVDLVGGVHMTANVSGGWPAYGAAGPFTETAVEMHGSEGFTGTSPWFQTSAVPFIPVFGGTATFTVESWIYPTSFAASSQTTIFYCHPSGGSTGVRVAILSNGKLYVSRNATTVTTASALTLNTWTHWRMTYDGSVVRLYINGVLDGTSAIDTSSATTIGGFVVWGNHAESGTFFWSPWNGRLADLAVYDDAIDEFCPAVGPGGPGEESATDGQVLTADGAGGTDWAYPTVDVDGARYDGILAGANLTSTDNGDGTVTLAAAAASAPPKVLELKVIDDATVITTGDGKLIFCIPAAFNGSDLTAAHAFVSTVSSSGLPTVQIRNVTQAADMLTTRITIDASEFTSYTAAAAPVIDTGNDDVATGDLIAVDIDVAGTGAKGLGVILTFTLP